MASWRVIHSGNLLEVLVIFRDERAARMQATIWAREDACTVVIIAEVLRQYH